MASLVLHPATLTPVSLSTEALIGYLHDIGLTSEESAGLGRNGFLIGEHFLQHLSFLGCAPALRLYPSEQGEGGFCYVHVAGTGDGAVQYLAGEWLKPVRCSACRKPVAEPEHVLAAWRQQGEAYQWNCPYCGAFSSPSEIDWRQQAGFFRIAIVIENVYPGEAFPVDALLSDLERFSGVAWRFFFAGKFS